MVTYLNPSEYDQSYFDGNTSGNPHPNGYFAYERSQWMNDEITRYVEGLNPSTLQNRDVLELGCAKGFLVEDLRALGVNAVGIDISQYAIDNAPAAVAPYVSVGDFTDLSAYRNNEFYLVYSIRSLECIDPVLLPAVIAEINRISRNQVHVIDEPTYGPTDAYNLQTKEQWATLPFETGTRIISYQTGETANV